MIDALGLKSAASFEPLFHGPVHKKAGAPVLAATTGAPQSDCSEATLAL
jgi:hypothetical protein